MESPYRIRLCSIRKKRKLKKLLKDAKKTIAELKEKNESLVTELMTIRSLLVTITQ